GAGTNRTRASFLHAGTATKSPMRSGARQPGAPVQCWIWFPPAQLFPKPFLRETMNLPKLDRLLSAASEFDASDLHLVVGVPPAFRVNGEIIIAEEDALAEQDVVQITAALLNEQQQKKFEQEWELCISLLHPAAGRVRATFYR